jgi:hypothetical protein
MRIIDRTAIPVEAAITITMLSHAPATVVVITDWK